MSAALVVSPGPGSAWAPAQRSVRAKEPGCSLCSECMSVKSPQFAREWSTHNCPRAHVSRIPLHGSHATTSSHVASRKSNGRSGSLSRSWNRLIGEAATVSIHRLALYRD
jgi:hypothetical protein